ncbi:MAG: hypothetical protein ACM4AI_24400, partial [Acidobacteriota bacterium]
MSILSFRSACALTIVALLTTSPTSQTPTDLAGRWRIVTSPAPADAANGLLFTAPTSTQAIRVERHLETGVVSEMYTTDPARPSMAFEARWTGSALILIKPGNDSRGAAPRTPDREETWSIGADGALHVDVTVRFGSAVVTKSHLVYERVPLPENRAGQNLLDNPAADRGSRDWLAIGDARVEGCDGNPCFVVR